LPQETPRYCTATREGPRAVRRDTHMHTRERT
jgi:hypothetical protein